MKLPDSVSRSGKALHYMISRQVIPKPEIDETALWFKVKGRVLRFSRVEFALITGLRFGPTPANFQSYKSHRIPRNSVFTKLLGNKEVLIAYIRTKFINKKFELKNVEVKGTEADYLKMAKVLLKDIPGPYHLKGNTIAFLELVTELNPTDKERETTYWKSLEQDPEKKPFAFQYDPNDNMKKRKRESEDHEDVAADHNGATTSTAAPVNPPLVPSNIQSAEDRETLLKEIGEYAGSVATKRAKIEVEALLRTQQEQMLQALIQCQKEQHQQLVEAVGDYIFKKLLEVEAHKEVQSDRLQKATLEAAVAGTTLPQMPAAASPSLAQEMASPTSEGTKEGEHPHQQHSQQPSEPVSEQANAVESELGDPIPPKVDILSTTTDIHPAICKNEKLGQVLPTLPAPTIHAPLSSTPSKTVGTESGIPKVILNVRPVRRRYPTTVHKSPFRPTDVRPGRDMFEQFLSLDHGVRNNRKQFNEPFNHKLFDNKTEEVVQAQLMERLCLFAEARQPNWGPNMKQWIDCENVVAMCNYKEHWGTLLIDFKKQKLVLYDSFQWIFEDHHITNRKGVFLPTARSLPQILKEIGYFEHHRIKKPILTQWELTLPPKTKNPFKQQGDVKCGLYALKCVEHILTSTPLAKHLRSERDAHNTRDHVTRTIYAHSTDEPIPMLLENNP
ncbi:hypothetical protein OROMI_025494 [Orobanche minor]